MADDPTAILAAIRDRAGVFAKFGPPRPALGFGSEVYNAAIASAEDAPSLLAAVEAVLELHRPVDRGTGAQCKGCATHVTFTWWPCPTYQAITAALAGKEASDGG